MLVIRFSRVGKKNHPQYRIVVAEKSAPIKGRFVEKLGSYDPHLKQVAIKEDRVKHWMDQGAQPSDSVWNLFVKEGIVKGDKKFVALTPKKGDEKEGEKEEGGEEKKEETPKEEAAKEAEAPAQEKSEEKKEEKPAEEKKDEAPKEEPKEKKEEAKKE